MKETKCLTPKCNRLGQFKNGFCFWCNRKQKFQTGLRLDHIPTEYKTDYDSNSQVRCITKGCNEHIGRGNTSNMCIKCRVLRNADIRTN